MSPDFFAAKGTNLILNSLRMRIAPYPLPKIGVFMNKTKTHGGKPTKESQFCMDEVRRVCQEAQRRQNIQARFFRTWIPERVGVKRTITSGGVPADLVHPFRELWQEALDYVGSTPFSVSHS